MPADIPFAQQENIKDNFAPITKNITMTLTDKEYKEFSSTHLKFLYFVGRQLEIYGDITFKAFLKLGMDIRFQCRRAVIQDMSLLDKYLEHSHASLSLLDLNILNAFRKQKCGQFIIFKCLSKHAIFIDTSDSSFYTVNALGDRFDELFYKFPVIVSTCILPFMDKIIYDGFIGLPVIYIGSNMRKVLEADYKIAKNKNKIRTSFVEVKTSK